MRKTIFISIFIFAQFGLFLSGIAQPKGVAISTDGQAPDESAILHLISNKKGALFPRMSFNAMKEISPVTDGLIVYVTDHDQKGFWYWNESEEDWTPVQNVNPDVPDVSTPIGAIVMYCGSFQDVAGIPLFDITGKGNSGTKMEGWQLCNGNNGAPDMRGRFVVGNDPSRAEYNQTGSSGMNGSNFFSISENQMPSHKHELNQVNGTVSEHTHTIIEASHTHTINVGTGDLRRGDRRFELKNTRNIVTMETYPESLTGQIKLRTKTKPIDYPVDLLDYSGEGKEIDNRPPFFVIAYIIRTDGGVDFKTPNQ